MIQDYQIQEFLRQAHRVGDAGLTLCSSGNISWRIGDEALVSGTGSWVPTLPKEKVAICRISDGAALGTRGDDGVRRGLQRRMYGQPVPRGGAERGDVGGDRQHGDGDGVVGERSGCGLCVCVGRRRSTRWSTRHLLQTHCSIWSVLRVPRAPRARSSVGATARSRRTACASRVRRPRSRA